MYLLSIIEKNDSGSSVEIKTVGEQEKTKRLVQGLLC